MGFALKWYFQLNEFTGDDKLFVQIWKSEELLIEICMEISYD